MKEAIELFTRIFFALTQRWSDTYSFRRLVELGLPYAAKITTADNLRGAREFLSDPRNDKIFLDKAKFLESSGGAEVMGATITQTQLTKFRTSVDSSSFVFMHSALDGAAFDLCRVATLVAPADWEPFIGQQKVQLLEVKGAGYDALFRQKLGQHLTALERESLLKKVDRLFQLCKPPTGFEPVRGYQFDREGLQDLDRLRHDIIHGENTAALPRNVEASIEFLLNTGLFLLGLVNHRYDVRLDPNYRMKTKM